jgi:hypothetical protein
MLPTRPNNLIHRENIVNKIIEIKIRIQKYSLVVIKDSGRVTED